MEETTTDRMAVERSRTDAWLGRCPRTDAGHCGRLRASGGAGDVREVEREGEKEGEGYVYGNERRECGEECGGKRPR